MRYICHKMHSLGNDFLIFNNRRNELLDIKKLAHRNYGIGADQVFFIDQINLISDDLIEIYISIYNQDGSIANMCINGIRCVIYWLTKKYQSKQFIVNSANKKLFGEYDKQQNTVVIKFAKKDITCNGNIVNTGNIHQINIVKDIKVLQNMPNNTSSVDISISQEYNKNYVYLMSSNQLIVYTIERGVGLTKACGSGMLASAYYCYQNKMIESEISIKTPSFEELGDLATIKFNDTTLSISGKCYYIGEINYLQNDVSM